VLTAGLVYFQPTEFGIKLAILSSLVVVCAAVPLIEQRTRPVADVDTDDEVTPLPRPWPTRVAAAAANPAIIAAAIITLAAPLNTAALAGNDQLILIERGLTADGNPQ